MKLYLAHCGFYDGEVCDGIYESHVNYFIVAENFEQARLQVKQITEYKSKRMHVDGLQELSAVNGYRIQLELDSSLLGKSILHNHKHRDLAPPPNSILSSSLQK